VKVLFVSPVVPWPKRSGGRIRTAELLRAVHTAVDVHLFCVLAPGEDRRALEPLRAACASVQGFPRSPPGPIERWSAPKLERWFHSSALEAALATELTGGTYDLVHLDEMFLARVLPERPGVPVCVHHHKLDTALHASLSAYGFLEQGFDRWKLRRLEAKAARRFPEHVACSELDAATLRARYPGITCAVVENGFDPAYFAPRDTPREARRILFLGSLGYGPNVDAVRVLLRELLPRLRVARPEVGLDLVGSAPAGEIAALAAATPGVELACDVDDVRPYLARAGALVVPLQIGGGTRLKIVEALGMQAPVVSTTIGAEGLALRDGEHLRIADGAEAFATAVLDVLSDPRAAQAMAARGRAVALERYTWERLGAQLLQAWRLIVRRFPVRP
jgi:glycosyltransferase involved in cell wall biosynthesis